MGRAPHDDRTLGELLAALQRSAPAERIDLREATLAFGPDCIGPLAEIAASNPDLAPSVIAWLEVLAQRAPDTKPAVAKSLSVLAKGRDDSLAHEALERLGVAARPAGSKPRARTPSVRNTAQEEVHARIIKAARAGRILTYSQLETSRGHVGKYLFSISRAEADEGHPPLTALVVSKTNGLPGDGFLPAMIEVGFAHQGESLEAVWNRAVADVHAFWAERDQGDK